MKKSKLKSPKRKVISHRYQKNSNTSLSKLLHIASYKKRINDLVYNNRRLARELQDAKREIALQNILLDKGAKSRNEVMFARLKLQDMATSITSLVADLDQARNHLLNSLSSDEIKFPMKEFPHPKKIVPTVDCIEEVSYVSSLDPSFKENTSPQPDISSLNSPSHLASVEMKNSDKILLNDSKSHDPEDCVVSVSVAPILFIEDNRDVLEKNVKQSSQTSGCQQNEGNTRSLTPELDIDFSLVSRRKSSSRRQTQFKLSNPRTAKSGGKSSLENSLLLLEPEKNYEHCLLSNNCQTKISNSRKTKSKGKISPEAISPLLKSKLIENSSLSNITPCTNSETSFKVSDIKKSKSAGEKSSQVISPPLNLEDCPVPAFHSRRCSLVKVSDPRKTKSRGKSSPKVDCLSLQSEEMSFEPSNSRRKTQVKITNIRKLRSSGKSAEAASTVMKCAGVSIETAGKQQDVDFNCSQSSKQFENQNNLSNLHCITEKLPIHFSSCLTSDVPSDCETFKILPDIPPNAEPLVTIPNHTLYLSEDMELTDVIAANPIILEYGTLNNDCYSEIKSHVPVNSNCFEKYNNSEEKPLKLDEVPEIFFENNGNLPIIKDNVQESAFIEQNKISEVIEDKTPPLDNSLLISSPKRSYRKNAVQYCFFSSSEPSDSDDEYIPKKSKKKRSSSGEKRETVIFKPDSNMETAAASNNFFEPEENITVKETSTYHFNVSHSEDNINQNSKNKPKKSKLSRDKNSVKKKNLPMKPLSQTCNVTKLKGFSYKFSKSKSPVGGKKLSKGYKQKKSSLSSNIYTSVLPNDSTSNDHTSHDVTVSQDKFSEFKVKDETKSVETLDKSVLKNLSVSEGTPIKQDTSFESVLSERKKVSFAPTDLVCKFKKMSLSKAIAANAKVRRVSKSVAELVDWSEENVEMKPLTFDKLNYSEDSLSDFNAETELYTNNLPSAPYLASQETNQQCPSNSVFSSITECDMAILSNKNLTNKNIKKEKVLKTKAVTSQQKLQQAVSPMKSSPEFKVLLKKDTTKRSLSLNKAGDSNQLLFSDEINDTKNSLCNFSDITDLYSVNLSSPPYLASQKIDQQRPLNSFSPVVECDAATFPNKNLTNKDNKRENVSKTKAVASQQKVLQATSPVKSSPEFKVLPTKDTIKRSPSLNKVEDSKQLLCSDKMKDSKDSLCDFSDITELYSINLPSDAPYPVDQQPPSDTNIPLIVVDKEVPDTCTKSLTNESILKKKNESSQKILLPKVSSAKRNSAFKILSVKTSKKSVKLYDDSKENHVQKHLETFRTDRQIKQRDPLSPIQPPQDDLKIKHVGTAERKLTSSAKSKKKVAKKITKSAPSVLKDHLDIRCSLMEIQPHKISIDMKDAAENERPKRRSNAVSYKEPSIRKKLRRS